ncbi:polysaccharide lyase family 7 protein [Zopfia rhizophila CBS 207.26]|uniref:Polysaccharide lyase family 7 protein n=1 Tax=Zopfia rhizophila CBS 207.26 TaxID=1314779 RepID=A0A6A6ET00_9PEZI|nr:polysaccharide lyase family 7 protein [Zopfia rhizophila CBS 207.26]
MSRLILSSLILCLVPTLAAPVEPNITAELNPSCAPGGNFDLSRWNLQLPSGKQGHVDTIQPAKLKSCDGYKDKYFFTDSKNGALVMKVPGSTASSGCVTTGNSKHCRTEFREINPSFWSPHNSKNRLKVQLAVPQPDDSGHGTVIGQIHVDDKISTKPVCELFYNKNGDISMGVEQIPKESSLKLTDIGHVDKGETFTYEIRYENNKLSVAINGGEFKTLGTGKLEGDNSYFKVGNYNQGDSPSDVRIYSIDVSHS